MALATAMKYRELFSLISQDATPIQENPYANPLPGSPEARILDLKKRYVIASFSVIVLALAIFLLASVMISWMMRIPRQRQANTSGGSAGGPIYVVSKKKSAGKIYCRRPCDDELVKLESKRIRPARRVSKRRSRRASKRRNRSVLPAVYTNPAAINRMETGSVCRCSSRERRKPSRRGSKRRSESILSVVCPDSPINRMEKGSECKCPSRERSKPSRLKRRSKSVLDPAPVIGPGCKCPKRK